MNQNRNKLLLRPFKAFIFIFLLSLMHITAQAGNNALPQVVNDAGHHALIVDGSPFLILGAQCHNSSAWPGILPKVWPAIDYLHANTLEIPVYWEQFEPEQGKFDASIVDLILKQAREHNVRLVLLWFGTWKNGSSHYLPLWAKNRPDLFPRMIARDGQKRVDSPSPFAPVALQSDARAFSALMRHLKSADPVHTVIMVQVENEPGTWGGTVRDYSPEAEKAFASPVPAELLQALKIDTGAGGNWTAIFGTNADEYFHAWSVARFIGQVAAAGKAQFPLPMYVNAALRDPLTPGPASSYESGGATDNVLGIWKAAAPAIDILAPDIYQNDSAKYRAVLDHYGRPDNALFVPETIGAGANARMCFAALSRGAIGWSPFGLDYTRLTEEALAPVGLNYRMLEPIMRELARLNFAGKVQAVEEETGREMETLDFGAWKAVIGFGATGRRKITDAPGNATPIGRALVAQLAENQFLVTGAYCKIDFKAASGGQRDFLRVEEAAPVERTTHSSGKGNGGPVPSAFHVLRFWNGDETDWSLSFDSAPQALRVTLGMY
ncbi:MAG: DUF5597 domain-containing protein [Verrucomicrobiota bacterium]|jgi:beta-galactosidase GanA